MEHLLLRLGRRRILLADVRCSADGRGVGYGQMLERIERVLRFGQVMGVPVLLVRPAKSINTAVFHLRSDDVEIVSPVGWRAFWLTCVWFATAPFRTGSPWLWTQRTVARVLLASVYEAVERSRYLPRALRRFVLRPRPIYRRLRAANAAYASLSSALWKKTFKQQASTRLRDAERQGIERPLRLALPADRERAAIEQAAALGISLTTPLVTVHVRESGYRPAAGLRQRRWDVSRNARVETYFDAFNALVERGYTIVRLGDRTMIPVQRPGVVDLATSPARTEWLEVWCTLRSDFFVGCNSGPSQATFLLGVPLLTVNAVHFGDVVSRPSGRFICKLAREKATGKILSLSEMLTEDYLRVGLEANKYDYLDNSPSDIRQAVIDMIDVVCGRETPSLAQRRFNERLVELGRECSPEWTGLDGIAFTRRPRGTLSRSFAEKYFCGPLAPSGLREGE
ncbi:MAG: TIGR04372 family glycosyltransferase [Acidobacteria bacterium]|nr:TIGR04372 family glycosyltransferase [Acidobacteriota bacterium]